jgi:regulator of protease activity HflC (stomatin/prohibitin superfamily)
MRKIMPQLIVISLLGLFVFIYFIPQIFITIHSGEGGVHFRRFFQGTVTDVVYGEGLQIIFPWDEMVVYNVRIQESKMTLDLLTSEGLSARVKVSVRYYPEYELLGMLHKRVGRNYAEVLVLPEVESVLRTEVSRLTAESLYTTSDLAVTQVVVKAIDELVSNYVVINDVIVESIELPPSVQKSIQEKIQQKHIAEAFTFKIAGARQEAIRKEIEARGYAAYNQIIDKSLSPNMLKWRGVEATRDLAASPNAKVVVIGNGPGGLPLILNSEK